MIWDICFPNISRKPCAAMRNEFVVFGSTVWISYPRADLILCRMGELVSYPPHDRMPALLLYGATGMGKTKFLRKFMRDHPPSFDNTVGITRMQIVSMQMPPEPDERSFWGRTTGCLGLAHKLWPYGSPDAPYCP
jgi:hypothetical protein